MEVGTYAAAKLEPFLLMSKSARGAAAAKLIQDATSAPGVFVFSELLDVPSIQELQNNEQHAPSFSLLQLFAYKTYKDYLDNRSSLPPLNNAQVTKLKHLSLVTYASEHRILSYDQLLHDLDISNIRELEDLIIDAIYLDVLHGKLDQKERQLEVEYTMGRDLEPERVKKLYLDLRHWKETTSSVLTALQAKIDTIGEAAAADKAHKEEHEKAFNDMLRDVMEKQKEKNKKIGGGALGVSDGLMDVDMEPPTAKVLRKTMHDAGKPLKRKGRA